MLLVFCMMQGIFTVSGLDKNMLIIKRSIVSGKLHEIDLPITEEQYEAGMTAMENGSMIQDAFPMLSEDHREFLLSGMTPEEWNETFPEEDEDPDNYHGLDDDIAF